MANTASAGSVEGVFDVKHQDFGAVGDGSTDDFDAIQAAIDAAGDAGGGVVWIPPTQVFYRITNSFIPRDNVVVRGAGFGSHIRNEFAGAWTDEGFKRARSSIVSLGAYESHDEWLAWADTFHGTGDIPAGAVWITPSGGSWTPGELVFLRTDARDPYFVQKDIPALAEINEIVETSGGAIRLRYPVAGHYASGRVAVAGTRTDRFNNPIFMVKRFGMEDLRLECNPDRFSPVFANGGAFECFFRNLWLTGSDGWLMQVVGRCEFSDIRVRFSRMLGEIAYLSHDNQLVGITAEFTDSQIVNDGYLPNNGFSFNEGARDNAYDRLRLQMAANGNRPLIIGGLRNKVTRSEIRAPHTVQMAAVSIMDPVLEAKPRGNVVSDVDIFVGGGGSWHETASFGVEVDGQANVVENVRVHGEPKVAMVGISRIDKRDLMGSQHGSNGNSVSDITQVLPAGAVPRLPGVVEYATRRPPPGGEPWQETAIDPVWAPGDNLIHGIQSVLRQRRVRAADLGASRETTPVPVASYTIPRYSVGTQHHWSLTASGRVPTSETAASKTIALVVGGATIGQVGMNAADTGSWRIEAEIGGRALGSVVSGEFIGSGATVMRRQSVRWRTLVNGVETGRGVSTLEHDFAAAALMIEVVASSGDAGADTPWVWVDEWTVEPGGDEWTAMPWETLKSIYGDYIDLNYWNPPSFTVPGLSLSGLVATATWTDPDAIVTEGGWSVTLQRKTVNGTVWEDRHGPAATQSMAWGVNDTLPGAGDYRYRLLYTNAAWDDQPTGSIALSAV